MAGICSGRGGCTLEACCAPDASGGGQSVTGNPQSPGSRRHRHHRPSSQPRQRGQPTDHRFHLSSISSLRNSCFLPATSRHFVICIHLLDSPLIIPIITVCFYEDFVSFRFARPQSAARPSCAPKRTTEAASLSTSSPELPSIE